MTVLMVNLGVLVNQETKRNAKQNETDAHSNCKFAHLGVCLTGGVAT